MSKIKRFFEDDPNGLVALFTQQWGEGKNSAAAVLNVNDELVIADGARSAFALIGKEEGGQYFVHLYQDVLDLINPDGDPEQSEGYSTIREAFTAACEMIECSLAEENSVDP